MATTILNHTVQELIHESANSLVYRARSGKDQTPRILKMLKNDYPTPEERTRYQQEYDIMRSLDIDGVAKVFQFEKHQNSFVMTVEDFGGDSLARLMKHAEFGLEDVLIIASTMAGILGRIHREQVIHKDVNPSNVIYNPQTKTLKIIDFGISTRLTKESPSFKNPRVLEGTLAYMSPEQTGRMNRAIDYRADFYSLGVTMYELLTGRLPFESDDPLAMIHAHIARQPTPPHELDTRIPEPVSAIVMKLMAKTAEERYQSGWGVQADIDRCLEQLRSSGSIELFELGTRDIPERFTLPEKLYGRDEELQILLEAFGRASQGSSEMMLVAGYSGIGKSALVQEVYKPITRQRGYFVSGKFDQLQRNVPYSAIVDAFADLITQLLTESTDELDGWKRELEEALGVNGQVVIDVIPEVELIIGPQPPAKELGAGETQNRFNLVLQNFIRVFCKPEHPLVVFLDDLQWADAATLKLLELLMTSELDHFFLIGAYRDNEVESHDPLMLTINRLREGGTTVNEIKLIELTLEHITDLVADTLYCDRATAGPLASLIVEKTQGNPFFVTQFLRTLYQNGQLVLQPPQDDAPGGWTWSIDEIRAMEITDNVVDLVVQNLKKLPDATQHALRLAACVGSHFDIGTLAIIHEADEQRTYKEILPAIQQGLLVPTSALVTHDADRVDTELIIHNYRFLHDRVQQAAYALIDESQKKKVHLEIGRLLLGNLEPSEQAERLFDIVDHINIGRELIVDPKERLRLVHLDLDAGKKAKFATAYDAAARYLSIAEEALSDDSWDTHYELTLEVYNNQTELAYLTGDSERMEQMFALVIEHARSAVDKAQVYKILLVHHTNQGRFQRAIELGKEALSRLGIELPDSHEGVLERVTKSVGDREVATLIDNPEITDPRIKEIQKLLVYVTPAAFLADQALFAVLNLVSVEVSLEHGNVAESSLGFANYGITLGSILGDYQRGHEFGLLGLEICKKYNGISEKAPICLIYGVELAPWVMHARACESFLDEGYKAGLESGEVQWSAYLVMYKVFNRAYQGRTVETILEDVDSLMPFSVKVGNLTSIDGMLAFQVVYRNLAGMTDGDLVFGNDEFDEAGFLANCEAHQGSMAICLFKIAKAHAMYMYGEHAAALELCREAEPLLPFIIAHLQLAEQNLFYTLALVALIPDMPEEQRPAAMEQVEKNQAQLKIWADNCPENFLHKYLLASAEIASLEGDHARAPELYDEAIASAEEHEYIQFEALAKELAANYWFARGKPRFGNSYLVDAHYAYLMWGAKRKAAMLEWKHPHLAASRFGKGGGLPSLTKTTTATTTARATTALDLATVLKASQTISGEIVLDALLSRLMTIAIENAGAELGYLIREVDGSWVVEASGAVDQGEVQVLQSAPVVAIGSEQSRGVPLPISVLNYVARTHKSVILKDAVADGEFPNEAYFAEARPKSVLCTPLVKQGNLSGILYLENNLTAGAFTPGHLEVLHLLSSQAAISIENATLYRRLEQETIERMQLIMEAKLASMSAMVAGIAHELRNPLNFIMNFAESSVGLVSEVREIPELMSGLSEADREDVDQILGDLSTNMERIGSHGKRANAVIQGMLSHAERSSGDRGVVDLNGLLTRSVRLAREGSSHRDFAVRIEEDYDRGIGMVEAVEADLERVFINVVENALYAMRQKKQSEGEGYEPTLRIQSTLRGSSVELRIRDNGTGISAETKKNVFDPFFTTKPPQHGTGLGLSLSHEIVVQGHQGALRVESEPGEWTEIIITLPVALAVPVQ